MKSSVVTRTLVSLAMLGALLAAASPAAATGTADVFRFWGYYQIVDAEWGFAQTGPDDTAPADGDMEGWRFATTDSVVPRLPRAMPAFDEVCGDTEAVDGEKRVAVVIDYGRPADGEEGSAPPEPRAACAVAPEAASGADVLAEVAEIRVADGLTCALDSYPATGCGDPVPEVSPEAAEPDAEVELALPADATTDAAATPADSAPDKATDDGGGIGAGLLAALGVVLVVAGLAVLALRRRRLVQD